LWERYACGGRSLRRHQQGHVFVWRAKGINKRFA
jgi:hypothetical protein